MEQSVTKSLLRRVALQYRRLLSEKDFLVRNDLLCRKIFDLVIEGKFKTIHTFLPMKRNNEPDVTVIFEKLRSHGITIVTSKTNFEGKTLTHFYLEEDTRLVPNSMGIPEPIGAIEADLAKVELVLVPLAAADKNWNRIGYGGGFYDQLLKNYTGKKIGLSLAPLLDGLAQTQDWDVPLDNILTPYE